MARKRSTDFETDRLNIVEQGLALCDAVNSDAWVAPGYVPYALEEKDSAASVQQAGQRLYPSTPARTTRGARTGQVAWAPVLAALRESGYGATSSIGRSHCR